MFNAHDKSILGLIFLLLPLSYVQFLKFCVQVQGSKFDSEGEYVRHWLPEIIRLPTEWIHHPWDAPDCVLKASGVELGLNYPEPIIDIDLARERLTQAIYKMREMEATADSNGTNEEVVDNSYEIEHMPEPKMLVKEKTSCPTYSSNDQRVPSFQDAMRVTPFNRKRPNCTEEEKALSGKLHNCTQVGTSRADEDVCSKVESSSSKKQTTSRNSFSVPHSFSLSTDKPYDQECESSDPIRTWQEQVDVE